jgi:geranylgeranyl diphosphate synthase type II
MRYTLFPGGKRLRPILTLAAAEAVGGEGKAALPVACAIELIHTYSLIHDDLPPVDDDDYRRGKPSNHKAFGEAMAIFAGDALLTLAFQVMTDIRLMPRTDPLLMLQVAGDIARAVGVDGMIGGQALDVLSQNREIEPAELDYIHLNKTASLIRVSACAGAILSGGSEDQVKRISDYGGKIGLAFQIADDLLDAPLNGDEGTSGNFIERASYPAVHGAEKSRRKAVQLVKEALSDIAPLGQPAEPLRRLAWYSVIRSH